MPAKTNKGLSFPRDEAGFFFLRDQASFFFLRDGAGFFFLRDEASRLFFSERRSSFFFSERWSRLFFSERWSRLFFREMKQAGFCFLREGAVFFFSERWSRLFFWEMKQVFFSSFTLFHQNFALTQMFLFEKSFERMKTIVYNSDNNIIKKCFWKKKTWRQKKKIMLKKQFNFFLVRGSAEISINKRKFWTSTNKKLPFLTFENFTLFHQEFFLTKMFLFAKSFERMKTIFDNSDNSIIKNWFLNKKRDDSTKKSGHF